VGTDWNCAGTHRKDKTFRKKTRTEGKKGNTKTKMNKSRGGERKMSYVNGDRKFTKASSGN
jgi:hypothetical protein